MSTRATIIDWHGPLPARRAWRAAEEQGWSEGLVVALGLRRPLFYPLRRRPVQHVGIYYVANELPDDRTAHALRRLTRSATRVWLGVPVSRGLDDEEDETGCEAPRPHDLQSAEHGLAYFLRARLDRRARSERPEHSFVVLNRWYDWRDGSKRARPHPDWPDIIDYDRAAGHVRLVWVEARSGRELTIRRVVNDIDAPEAGWLTRFALGLVGRRAGALGR